MAKFKIEMEVDKKDLRSLDSDLDKLFTGIGTELASAPKMQPMVDKIRQGMTENDMKFSNEEIYAHHKKIAKQAGLIDFDSPLMVSGQLVQDFIFHAGKRKVGQLPYSDEFVVGVFTWAAKERRRPTLKGILNETARKRGYGKVDEQATEYTYIKSNELVKMIMKSPKYPIMDAISTLYTQDIQRHCEKLINDAFNKRK